MKGAADTARDCTGWHSMVTVLCAWLQGRHMDIMNALRRYVADEYDIKMEKKVDTSEWKIRCGTASSRAKSMSLRGMCVRFAVHAEHVAKWMHHRVSYQEQWR